MSWENLKDCNSYKFGIQPGHMTIDTLVNHTYKATVKLKGSINPDVMKFEKKINMATKVDHTLKNLAIEDAFLSIDDYLNAATPPSFPQWPTYTAGIIPWAQLYGFEGKYNELTFTPLAGGEAITTTTLDSVWDGSLTESLDTFYGNFDFSNLRLDAHHISKETRNITANTISTEPVGWAQLAQPDGGFKGFWIDFVGFRDYEVIVTPESNNTLYLGGSIDRTSEIILGEEVKSTYWVLGSISDLGGDLKSGDRYWETINPIGDPNSDGYELGWSHWMMDAVVSSRWRWLGELIEEIITGKEEISTNVPTYGSWEGNIVESRIVEDEEGSKASYILGSDKVDSYIYKKLEGTISATEKPEGLEDVCYPISPL